MREARSALLDTLAHLPADDWTLGQRVWYLLEAERPEEAVAAARECGGSAWWCSALEGLALHVLGLYREAEGAFDRALLQMDPIRAARWTALSGLRDGYPRGIDEDPQLLRRAWDLADPLHLVNGNVRRTEHFARRTVIRIRSDAANTYGLSWGEDMAELLLRYGWEIGWERTAADPRVLGGTTGILGHQHPDIRAFLPPWNLVSRARGSDSAAWFPVTSAFMRSGYTPAYAPVLLPINSRFVVLTRGDYSLVGAPFTLPTDTTYRTRTRVRDEHRPPPAFWRQPVQAGLFLSERTDGGVHFAREEGTSRGVMILRAPAGSYRASIEVLDPQTGHAGVYRKALTIPDVPPDVPMLSDLLVLEGKGLPGNAGAALERLRAGEDLVPGEPTVLAWEIWGLGGRVERLRYRLTIRPVDRGLLNRVGAFLGLVRKKEPWSVQWEDAGPLERGPAFQALSITLPGGLTPGDYLLRLEVATEGRTPMVRTLRVRLVDPRDAGSAGTGGEASP